MKNKMKQYALLVATSSMLTAFSASAATTYAAGDLVLSFQKAGGTDTVYANLGNAATLFRGAAAGPDAANRNGFMNLKSTLDSAFGDTWATDTSIYAGVAGVYSSSDYSEAIVNGDAARTLYVSSSRVGAGTVGEANSSQWYIPGDTAMSDGASAIGQQNAIFASLYPNLDQVVSPAGDSRIDDLQPLVLFGSDYTQGLAFYIFDGGIQQVGGSYEPGGSTAFSLDLYRIVAGTVTDKVGQVYGDVGLGSYEGTVTVGTNGLVSFTAVPEPSALALTGLAAGSFLLRRRRSAK